MSRKSEREAAEKAQEILRRASGRGGGMDATDAPYGAGRLTKAQRKSQEKHIPMTPGPKTLGGKIKRSLFG